MSQQDTAVLLDAVALAHGFEYTLFEEVNLRVCAQDRIAIVGRSGSGKSTLLHILSGFLPPQKGYVTIEGKDLYHLSTHEQELLRRTKIGMVFQFHYLFRGMRAVENIQTAALLAEETIDPALLDALEITSLLEAKSATLSGGQQQRVSLARVLSKKPCLIFADEPTGNLDDTTARLVMEVLTTYVRDHQAALILVTHDNRVAAQCDRQYRLNQGRLM